MNRAIATLFRVLAVGLVLLLAFTAYWQLWAAPVARSAPRQRPPGLPAALDPPRPDPGRRRHEARDQPRGRDGRRPHALHRAATRRSTLFAHVVGYTRRRRPRRRRALGERLPDRRAHRPRRRRSRAQLHSLAGGTVTGDDVSLALSSVPAQRRMSDLAATRQGGRGRRDRAQHRPRARERVVAELQPQPGRAGLRPLEPRPAARSLNRATQGLYPPGSTFKPVTAALALESGRSRRTAQFDAGGTIIEAHGDLQRRRRALRHDHRLTTRSRNSVNTYFAQLGQQARAGAARRRTHAALRLLPDAAARLPDRPDDPSGLLRPARTPARAERADRPRPRRPSARTTWWRRRCRWRWSRRRSPTAAS